MGLTLTKESSYDGVKVKKPLCKVNLVNYGMSIHYTCFLYDVFVKQMKMEENTFIIVTTSTGQCMKNRPGARNNNTVRAGLSCVLCNFTNKKVFHDFSHSLVFADDAFQDEVNYDNLEFQFTWVIYKNNNLFIAKKAI